MYTYVYIQIVEYVFYIDDICMIMYAYIIRIHIYKTCQTISKYSPGSKTLLDWEQKTPVRCLVHPNFKIQTINQTSTT